KRISNPVGYLLTTLRQARAGLYRLEPAVTQPVKSRSVVPAEPSAAGKIPTCSAEADVPAGQEVVKAMVEQIRQRMNSSQ
ncbi:helix-turn-helix domain-containing protein, partial [Salmonella enterica subsp. enterica serovar Java]